jgi:HAD superfamily phosphatase
VTGLPDGAYIRDDLRGDPFACDTVILDVDGVLVDVSRSFREVIRRTATHVQRLMGVADPWTPSPAGISAFKRAGGFNDDIDMSIAMTAIGAGGLGDQVMRLAHGVEEAGGGLRGLREVAPDLPRVEGRLVLRVFDEYYWGRRDYLSVFAEPAQHVDSDSGLIDAERPLVGVDFVNQLRATGVERVALITGRTPVELSTALRRLRWANVEIAAVVTGDMVRKPDPVCLDIVFEQCKSTAALYVGDVRDDWELVRRFRAERHPPPADVRCVLVGGDEEMAVYREMGVDATVSRTQHVTALVRQWRFTPSE